jgi:hypothetical protein
VHWLQPSQTLPHPPQLFGSLSETHWPLQKMSPFGHPHEPLWQISPGAHVMPQPPQLLGSVWTLTHWSLQQVLPVQQTPLQQKPEQQPSLQQTCVPPQFDWQPTIVTSSQSLQGP